jgi:hypothetical protein
MNASNAAFQAAAQSATASSAALAEEGAATHIRVHLYEAFALPRQAHLAAPNTGLVPRRGWLKTLRRFIKDEQAEIGEAISRDHGHRSRHETLLHLLRR